MVELSTTSGGKTSRVSHDIKRKPVSNLYHAPRIAAAIGAPLNTHVTINFALTTCETEKASQVFERLRNRHFGPWVKRPPRRLKRENDPCVYAWVLENPGDLNAHWALHLPEDRAAGFKELVEKWLMAIGIKINSEHAVRVDPAPTPVLLMYYLMKGVNPAYAPFYGIKHTSPQGPIVGKRSGVSRSLGPTRKALLRETGLYRRVQRRSLEGLQLGIAYAAR